MEDDRSPEEIRRAVVENRVAFEKALRQLKQQVNLSDSFEVIVVDDL